MKLKVNYDTGPVVVTVRDDELAALILRKEREADLENVASSEKARQKRKLLSVEVVP